MPAPWISVALVALTLLLVPSSVLAQRSALEAGLRYEVEASVRNCPSSAELRDAIAQQLGYDPFPNSSISPSYDVHVKIGRYGRGLEARIEWVDEQGAAQGERRLGSEDDDCIELASGVAFAVAVQLQLQEAHSAQLRLPEPKPKPAPPTKPSAPSPTKIVPTRAVLWGVGGEARVGSQPEVAAGLRTFVALQGESWALSADAHATLPTSVHSSGRASFSARELGVGSALCLRYRVLDACAVGTLTLMSIQGTGVDHAKSPSSVGLGVGFRLQSLWSMCDRLAALAHVDLVAQPIQRDVLLNRERVWSSAPVAVAIGFDMVAIFR